MPVKLSVYVTNHADATSSSNVSSTETTTRDDSPQPTTDSPQRSTQTTTPPHFTTTPSKDSDDSAQETAQSRSRRTLLTIACSLALVVAVAVILSGLTLDFSTGRAATVISMLTMQDVSSLFDGSQTMPADDNVSIIGQSVTPVAVIDAADIAVSSLSPIVSPDGKQVVFVSDQSGLPQLYLLHPASSTVRQLTKSPGQKTNPKWSPDGRYLSFLSTYESATGQQDLWLMDVEAQHPAPHHPHRQSGPCVVAQRKPARLHCWQRNRPSDRLLPVDSHPRWRARTPWRSGRTTGLMAAIAQCGIRIFRAQAQAYKARPALHYLTDDWPSVAHGRLVLVLRPVSPATPARTRDILRYRRGDCPKT